VSTTSTVQPGKNPPAEQFWQRYSPHYEAPISGISSVVLHLLPFALLVAMLLLGSLGFTLSNREKSESRVVILPPGGGGGDLQGKGNNPGDSARSLMTQGT
jgi:hypothetical protein